MSITFAQTYVEISIIKILSRMDVNGRASSSKKKVIRCRSVKKGVQLSYAQVKVAAIRRHSHILTSFMMHAKKVVPG